VARDPARLNALAEELGAFAVTADTRDSAAGGLTAQMLLALVARRKIKDSVIECLPAFFFCALNAWLLAGFLQAV
jgi:hypothetical protein